MKIQQAYGGYILNLKAIHRLYSLQAFKKGIIHNKMYIKLYFLFTLELRISISYYEESVLYWRITDRFCCRKSG